MFCLCCSLLHIGIFAKRRGIADAFREAELRAIKKGASAPFCH